MLSGMAAIAIGFAAAFRFQGIPNLVDLPRLLGPIVGGLLLAALAADASSASDRLSGKDVQQARKRLERAKLEQILAREDRRSRESAGKLQGFAVFVVFPVAFTCLLQLAWPIGPIEMVVRAFGILMYVVLLSGIAEASWRYFLLGDRLSLAAFSTMTVAVVVLLLGWLLFDQPSGGYADGHSLLFSVVSALSAVIIPLVVALWMSTGWIRLKTRGIGEERVLRGFRRRALELNLPEKQTRAPIIPWAAIMLVVPFPPLGVWLAHNAFARAGQAGDRVEKGIAVACLVIGYLLICMLVTGAAFLTISNPSLT
jgi:hypothetical protein